MFEVKGKVSLDGSGFQRTMKGIRSHAASELGGLKSQIAGAFTIGAIVNFGKHLEQTVGRIKDLSEQYRVTTDEVQQVDFATKQSGLSFEDFGTALDKLAQTRRNAVEGNDELRATFEKYGITLKELNDPQLQNIDLAKKMAASVATMTLTSREQAEITDLLGKKSAKLLTVMQELGSVEPPGLISQESIERVDKLSKALDVAKSSWTSFFGNVAGGAVEKTSDLFNYLLPRAFGGTGKGEAEEAAAAMPVFKKELEELSAKKRARLEKEAMDRKEGLFEVDKEKKEKKEKAERKEAAPQMEFQRAEAVNSLARIGGFVGNAGAEQETKTWQREVKKTLQDNTRIGKSIETTLKKALEQ